MSMKIFYKVLLVAVAAVVVLVFSGVLSAQNQIFEGPLTEAIQKYMPDEIIVKFKPEVSEDEIGKINSRHGISVFYTSPFARFKRLMIPPGKTVPEMVEIYRRNPKVKYAEANYFAYALMVPNDTYYNYQWHMDNPVYGGIQMKKAWDIQTGSSSVVVAVIDTGVAYENYVKSPRQKYYLAPDLTGTTFVAGYDFVENDTHPNDDNSHGTHVTGTIAQTTNNSKGCAGVAFNTSIMPVKVLDRNGSGTYADVADGIYWATNNGADVINLSLGGSSSSTTLENAVKYAYENGVTVIAAAGNSGAETVSYPAAYDAYVICVGATRYDEARASYSSYYSTTSNPVIGRYIDLAAPGGDLNVDQNGDGYGDGVMQNTFNPNTKNTADFGYWFFQGTSMATPHVSGVAALLIAEGVATVPAEIREALQSTAEDKGPGGWDPEFGSGIVDAYAALQWTPAPVDNPPTVAVTSPANGATVSAIVTITADASDDAAVTQVEFFMDSASIGVDLDGSDGWAISWDSTSVADGSHTIIATATDTASQTNSASISITVNNINDPPVANAGPDQTVSDADGTGSESVALNGSGSYDPDGTIVAYQWTEGSTRLGNAATITCDFAVGIHTVTLTVTDDKDESSSDETIITVNANQSPTANAGSDKEALVGQSVNFDGSGSSDPDGSIVSYTWDFGDGATGSGVTANHTYSAAGTYTVTLTVTDNGGATGQDTAIVTVTEKPAEIGVFTDSFESGLANWVQDSQNDWFRSNQRSVDGSYCVEVDGLAKDAQLISKPINLQARTNATITFSWFIESSLDTGEYLAFDVSTNGGTTWTEKARLKGNVDKENAWHNVSIKLTNINSLRLRFRGKMSGSEEDANVDMVKVVAW